MQKMLRVMILSFFLTAAGFSQTIDTCGNNFILNLLQSHKNIFDTVLSNPSKYKVQILYTQINRDGKNIPHFKSYSYRLDPGEYFYPASTVKLPAVALSLEKLNRLNIPGLNKYTDLRIDSSWSGQTPETTDSTSANGLPSIAQYAKKILLVSDNYSFNRLFEFLGQQYFNQQLWMKRYCHVKILRRLSFGFSPEENRHTNSFDFYSKDKIVYHQPAAFNPYEYTQTAEGLLQGKGFIRNDSLIDQPMDFTYSNYFALDDQHAVLKALLFPDAVPAERRFDLTSDDYKFLYKYMSMLPRESVHPSYNNYNDYWDGYVKFFMYGDTKDTIPSYIRIFNKVGDAYGYLIDNAYIVDFKHDVEFMLSAVIYVNEDGIFNDDKYEYDTIGLPFLANLGRVIYSYELQRPRKFKPDLSRFRINYESSGE